uniref:Uncharacterized protein n=1 Tax=Knipowitschia caucasica TaxID=637954 RepID=A0AAV2LJW6_KNICA
MSLLRSITDPEKSTEFGQRHKNDTSHRGEHKACILLNLGKLYHLINKGENGYTYVDASIDDHSNWMRYVNSARNKDEANLIAVQYKGTILFHCCGTIHAGDELTVWPSSKMLDQFSEDWTQFWFSKLNIRESETLVELGMDQEERVYKCPLCDKSYASAQALKNHACVQQTKILYLCTDCGKGFTNKYGLKQHQRIHTGEKPNNCPHCPKTFAHVGQLNVHLRTHTGEKPYLCTHCGDSFRQSGDLKRHERRHTGIRPHTCPECGKGFSRPTSLKAHIMLHLGQRIFKCTQCGKSFSRNYHLRRHHQKMHS